MRVWLLDKWGGLQHLRLGDVPTPQPAAGEALLAVHYAGLNPADRYLAEGQYPAQPPLPHILGRDGSGEVIRVGAGVRGIHVGERMAILPCTVGIERPGAFAQYVAVPAEALVPIPTGWSEPEAAGASLVYLTACQALTQWGELPPSVVLVTGASGGVGVASVQLAHAMGHTVVALSRSDEKRRRLVDMGAGAAFDPHDPQWRESLKKFLGARRVDLIIDSVGGSLLPDAIGALGMHGKVSVVGRLAGPVPQFNTASLFFRRIRLGGVAVGTYSPAESRAAWNAILVLLGKTGAKPIVDRIFPFEQLPDAFQRLEEGPMGKVLVEVGKKE